MLTKRNNQLFSLLLRMWMLGTERDAFMIAAELGLKAETVHLLITGAVVPAATADNIKRFAKITGLPEGFIEIAMLGQEDQFKASIQQIGEHLLKNGPPQ